MVMLSSTRAGRVLKFHSGAVPRSTLLLSSFQGSEALSQPYRFELELVSASAEVDLEAVLQAPAFLGIKQPVPVPGAKGSNFREIRFHGAICSFELCEGRKEAAAYRAVLVPRIWRLSLNVRSRIFMDKTVPEIVEEILKENGFDSENYEFATKGRPYPKVEYLVQHVESDLNFISRLLEREGIYYLFRHEQDREVIVFGDSIGSYGRMLGESTIPYRPSATQEVAGGSSLPDNWLAPETVQTLTCRQEVVPGEVVLKDYNWRTPGVDLRNAAPVADRGAGALFEYGEHYKDSNEGKTLAQVRAEELKCRARVLSGTSNCRSFRAGIVFELQDHYRADFNRSYLLTEVWHQADQSFRLGVPGPIVAKYRNEFECVPAEVAFRPERITPKPKITGALNARIDGAGSGEYAEIDEQGRYKVQLPFDPSGKDKGRASRWIRMAQPYAGQNYGFHFPLHKGTEVLLTHVNGDPDRPVIAGAVPNPETGTPVSKDNHSQAVIRTGSDNQVVIEDLKGTERILISTPHSKTHLTMGATLTAKDGLTAGTNGWAMLGGQKGVYLCAGQPSDGLSNTQKASTWTTIAQTAAAGITGIALSGTTAGSWRVGVAASLVAAGAGAWSMKSASLNAWAPGGINLATSGALNCVGLAGVGIVGATGVSIVGGPLGVTVASANGVAVSSIGGGVAISSLKGNVSAAARTGKLYLQAGPGKDTLGGPFCIVVDAARDVVVQAKKNIHQVAKRGWALLETQKQIRIESKGKKKIELVTGTSSIVLEKNRIILSADSILVRSNDKKALAVLGKDGKSAPVTLVSKGKMALVAEGDNVLSSKKRVALRGSGAVKVVTPLLDEKGAKKISRKHSREG